jgi:hypothetical protein
MIKAYSLRLCFLCLCVVIGGYVGMCLDQRVHALPPSCDNKCRSRTMFYSCTAGGGYVFNDATCSYCTWNAAYRCETKSDPNPNARCTDSGTPTTQWAAEMCTMWCACDPPGTWTYDQVVEGTLAGMTSTSVHPDYYYCPL